MEQDNKYYLTVKRFCESYNVTPQTVYKKICLHKDKELAGHILDIPGDIIRLDDFAVEYLVPVSAKLEHFRNSYFSACSKNANMENELERKNDELDEMRHNVKIVSAENEEYRKKLNDASEQFAALKRKNEELAAELEKAKDENASLRHELDIANSKLTFLPLLLSLLTAIPLSPKL